MHRLRCSGALLHDKADLTVNITACCTCGEIAYIRHRLSSERVRGLHLPHVFSILLEIAGELRGIGLAFHSLPGGAAIG